MEEKKITITNKNKHLKYEIQGNITGKEAMEMLFETIMSVNDEINEGTSEIERYKNRKILKEILTNIFNEEAKQWYS